MDFRSTVIVSPYFVDECAHNLKFIALLVPEIIAIEVLGLRTPDVEEE